MNEVFERYLMALLENKNCKQAAAQGIVTCIANKLLVNYLKISEKCFFNRHNPQMHALNRD